MVEDEGGRDEVREEEEVARRLDAEEPDDVSEAWRFLVDVEGDNVVGCGVRVEADMVVSLARLEELEESISLRDLAASMACNHDRFLVLCHELMVSK